jgi:phasin family protein
MFTNPEQFASATKTLFDLQVQTFNALATKAVQGVEQVVALNMATAKSALEGTLATGREASQASDPKAALEAVQARMQPGVSEATAYGEQLRQIIGDIQKDFQQAADTHLVEAKNTLSALIYDVTQNVKPGSENAVEVIKSAIDNVFQGYEKVTQATRQAVQTVEEQIAKATAQVMPRSDAGAAAGATSSKPAENA